MFAQAAVLSVAAKRVGDGGDAAWSKII
jgi:hypothetical protein